MRKKNYKGRCEKRVIPKCTEVCRTYDAVQSSCADVLSADPDIMEIQCNVPLAGKSPTERINYLNTNLIPVLGR